MNNTDLTALNSASASPWHGRNQDGNDLWNVIHNDGRTKQNEPRKIPGIHTGKFPGMQGAFHGCASLEKFRGYLPIPQQENFRGHKINHMPGALARLVVGCGIRLWMSFMDVDIQRGNNDGADLVGMPVIQWNNSYIRLDALNKPTPIKKSETARLPRNLAVIQR